MNDDRILETLLEVKANQAIHGQILDKHSDTLEKISETLLRNTVTVETHERRSTMLEAELKTIKADVDGFKAKKIAWMSIGKGVVAVISAMGGIAYAVWYLIKIMKVLG